MLGALCICLFKLLVSKKEKTQKVIDIRTQHYVFINLLFCDVLLYFFDFIKKDDNLHFFKTLLKLLTTLFWIIKKNVIESIRTYAFPILTFFTENICKFEALTTKNCQNEVFFNVYLECSITKTKKAKEKIFHLGVHHL